MYGLSLSMYIIIKKFSQKLGICFILHHVRLYCDFIKIFLIHLIILAIDVGLDIHPRGALDFYGKCIIDVSWQQ